MLQMRGDRGGTFLPFFPALGVCTEKRSAVRDISPRELSSKSIFLLPLPPTHFHACLLIPEYSFAPLHMRSRPATTPLIPPLSRTEPAKSGRVTRPAVSSDIVWNSWWRWSGDFEQHSLKMKQAHTELHAVLQE